MKKVFNYVLLALVTVFVLYFSLKDNYDEIINTLLKMDIRWVLAGFLCLVIYWGLKTLPLYYFTKSHKKTFKYKSAVILLLRTQFVNAITPFATGGQPYQIYYLKKEGIRSSTSTGIILQNFIVYQIALVFLGLIALVGNLIFDVFPHNDILSHLIALGFIVNTFVIVLSFAVAFFKKFNKIMIKIGINILNKLRIVKDKEKQIEKWNESVTNFHESAKILIKDRKLFISMIFTNLIALLILYLVPLFVFKAMASITTINIFNVIVASSYVMLIGSFVPIPGGTGGLEYGFIKFYGYFVSGGILSAAMLIWRFITYYFGLIVGGIAFNIKKGK